MSRPTHPLDATQLRDAIANLARDGQPLFREVALNGMKWISTGGRTLPARVSISDHVVVIEHYTTSVRQRILAHPFTDVDIATARDAVTTLIARGGPD